MRNPLDAPIVHTLYETYRALHDLVIKFPKSQRYALGQTCQRVLLETIEGIVAAASEPIATEKRVCLRRASVKLDLLRLLFRLAKDCSCLPNRAYLDLESKLHETGRMLGGWIRSLG